MEVFDPAPRRTEQLDWKLKLFQQLNEYTSSLVLNFPVDLVRVQEC